jgi:sterol desaturase/sphingolipid hydroxylase (fatty acid hydroxylase superfamily)
MMIDKIFSIINQSELSIRMTCSGIIFLTCALWEIIAPKRSLPVAKSKRWFTNLSIIISNSIIARIIMPIFPITIAIHAQKANIGLFNYFILPDLVTIISGVIILDLIIYLQHVMFHTVPILWRLHMMHHADLGIDLTTGLRFHPIEIILSLWIKIAAIYILGLSPFTVLIFEIILNGMAMFNHGNIRLPVKLDKIIRMLIVTPDMHRVHHSVTIRESNSNFGFNISLWDRLFGTYRAQPARGHHDMSIGLAQYRDQKQLSLIKTLLLPFIGNPGLYAINKWGREP